MNKKLLLTSITGSALFLSVAGVAHANQVPDFGSCLNPQWAVTQTNLGTNHGVVGIGAFSGTDTIYASGGNVMQCLCTGDGKGYQTNWLKADNISSDQISTMKTQGWIYVPYGDDWGLDKTPYLAKNSEYTCASCSTTPTPTVTETPTPTPTSVTSTPAPTDTPTTTPAPTTESKVLGLAYTGNGVYMLFAILAGAASLAVGTLINRARRNK